MFNTVTILTLLCVVALSAETIDSCLGMMYGTLLSPLLIGFGLNPHDVIASILLSQSIGGFFASLRHHKLKNANLSIKSKNFLIAMILGGLGTVPIVGGAYLAISIPKYYLQLYIGFLVIIVGLAVLVGKKFNFGWNKIAIISAISTFNKSLSGGGYGPLVTNGLIVSGIPGKIAIATTDLSEIPVCLAGFICWTVMKGHLPDLNILIPLCIGSAVGGLIGPGELSKIQKEKTIIKVTGFLAVLLGILCIFGTVKP